MSDFATISAVLEAGTGSTRFRSFGDVAIGVHGVLDVVERPDARHPRGVVCVVSQAWLGWASSDRSLQSRYMSARATLPSMCGRWPVADSVKLRSLSPCLLARPCKVPAAEGFSVEIFRRDLLNEGRCKGHAGWVRCVEIRRMGDGRDLEVSSPRSLEKMSSEKEGIAMGNKRASSFDSMLWRMFSGGTNHDPQESGAGRWRTT